MDNLVCKTIGIKNYLFSKICKRNYNYLQTGRVLQWFFITLLASARVNAFLTRVGATFHSLAASMLKPLKPKTHMKVGGSISFGFQIFRRISLDLALGLIVFDDILAAPSFYPYLIEDTDLDIKKTREQGL